jgi:uncharacterized protein
MKSSIFCIAVPLMTLGLLASIPADAQVVISQIYGGGGNSGATYSNDFIELYNTGTTAVTMTNWQVAYASAAGTSWTNRTVFTGTIPSHGYFLISEQGGSTGVALPTADVVGTQINLSSSAGKVALLNDNVAIGAVTCPTTSDVVDLVSYGTTATVCKTSNAPNETNSATSVVRMAGNPNTGNNGADFTTVTPPNPRNSSSVTGPLSLTLTRLNPNMVIAGSAATAITLTGTDFGTDSVVNFSGQNSIVPGAASITATSIVVTVPASYIASIGSLTVTVTSGGATSNGLPLAINSTPTCTETATIAQIQGSGDKSSFVSKTNMNTSLGTVTYLRSTGFFMQMATGDGDPNTSDAIFVFTSSAPTVHLGDSVCVTGLIDEFYNGGSVILTDTDNTLTEYGSVSIMTISTGNPLPAPITLAPNAAGTFDQLERYEGMRVTVPSLTVTGPGGVSVVGSNAEADGTYTPSGAFWGVVTGTPRPFQEVGIDAAHPIYVENSTGASYGLLPTNVTVFDSNPERIQIYTGNPGATVLDVSVGAVVTGITGVLDVYYGDFELDQDSATTPNYVAPTVSNNSLTFTAAPARNANELTVATYNLEHFYDDVQNGVNTPFEIVLTTPTYQGRLTKVSMAIRNVLMTPDILEVEEAENLGVLEAMSAKISSDAVMAGQTDPHYAAYLVQGNDPSGINVGFLVNPSRVSNVTTKQYFATDTYSGTSLTFDRPPLLLSGTASNAGGAPLPFTVIGNHLKALPDDDPTAFNATGTPEKRQAEAQELAQFIQSLQAANPKILLTVLGDLNSYEFNDGVNDVIGALTGNTVAANQVIRPNTNVVSPPLTELATALLPASQRQSYTESGNALQLDHILMSTAAYARVTRFAIAHLDADFRESLHYDYTRPERLSDHDAEIAYLSLPAATDVTSSVTVAISGLILNRGTQLYTGTVTLTNKSAVAIGSPVQLFFNGLPTGVTLANATGSQGGLLPYITSGGTLGPGASVTIPVQFQVAAGARVSYTNNVYSGTL